MLHQLRLHASRALALAFLVIIPSVRGFDTPTDRAPLPNLDRRLEKAKVATSTTALAKTARIDGEAKLRARLPELQLDRNEILGSPQRISARDGFLTGPQGRGLAMARAAAQPGLATNDPNFVVKSFVNEHAALFGHNATVLDQARLKRDYVTEHNGLHTSLWQQEHEGIEVFEALFLANTTKNGELINISSQFVADLAQAAVNGRGKLPVLVTTALPFSAQQAIVAASVGIGEEQPQAGNVTVLDEPSGLDRKQTLRSAALKGDATAQLVWLPFDGTTMRLCWKVLFTSRSRSEAFRVLVDAETGEIMVRHCLTDYISNVSYRVFTNTSPTPFSPGYATPGQTAQPAAVSRTLVTLSAINTTASPNGWIDDGVNETRGNNIDAHTDLDDDNLPDLPRPQGSPNRVFDFPLNLAQAPSTYRSAAVVNLFYWCNWMHDKLYELGFTEASGNFQNNNFGRGGIGNDAVLAQAQDGSGVNNANFSYTDADGQVCRIQMYTFTGPTPDRDGDLDAEVILHEYTHGLSHRLVGGGGLTTSQSDGMGEGWSDFYALALLSNGSQDPNANYTIGGYVTQNLIACASKTFAATGENYYYGIRRYPYTTDLNKNPLTFKDIDLSQADPHVGVAKSVPLACGSADEVHDQGEVWCVTLWQARANLIAKYGFATGNQRILQLVTDGMKLSPHNPNFVQARDAILQADLVLTGGADKNELWAAFAKRGLGLNATSPSSTSTFGVFESFDVPDKMRIIPGSGLAFAGPAGGPFAFTNVSYVISNTGPGSITVAAYASPPLEITPLSVTLAAGGKATATVTLSPTAAALLAEGTYSLPISFSNQTSSIVLTRTGKMTVGLRNYLMQEFAGTPDAFDLSFNSLTFTPDGSPDFYSACLQTSFTFPVSTVGATKLPIEEFDLAKVTLTGGKHISLFGTNYSSIFVSFNGCIGFSTNSDPYPTKLSEQFSEPRISPFTALLTTNAQTRVSWQQLADRVVVNWENMVDLIASTHLNNFQTELFFDGTIRMTFLSCATDQATTGLSSGHGLPADFRETDFSTANACNQLSLVVPANVQEGAGVLVNQGLVTLSTPLQIGLNVSLSSSDTTEVTVPASVFVPAGATSAVFSITVQNDAILDGTQIAYLTASLVSFAPAVAIMHINDNESAALAITALSAATEGGALGQGRVTLATPVGDTVVVSLSSSRPDELLPVPPFVFIPQGATSAVFTVTAVDDNRIDGPQTAVITATVSNWTAGSAVFSTLDNESTNLSLAVTFLVSENSGLLTNGGLVSLSGILPTNLLVGVFSGDESKVITPLFGVFIPAGQSNAFFNVYVVDDAVVNGFAFVQLTAVAPGFGSATNYMFILDNDGPPDPFNPSPADGAGQVSLNADLSWGPIEGELLVNGNFETGDLTGWNIKNSGAGGWVVNNGSFNPQSPDSALPSFAGGFSGLSQQLGNGKHALYQDVTIPLGATTATLTWMDQVRNHAANFAANQQFRLEVRNPDTDAVLATLFSTTNGPLFNNWTNRSVNLNPWRGQTVRLAFVEEDTLGYLNVQLDNISLQAGSASPTAFDVYFGTNPTPVDLLGGTTNTSWTLPLLSGGTDYYWQVKVRRAGSTNDGPVWHFTTESASSNATFVAFASPWKIRNTGTDLGTTWTNLSYGEVGWLTGSGILGFGGKEDTTIGFASDGYVTYYFRKKFTVSNAADVSVLAARLIRDDGAVVYLNGHAIIANNFARGAINYLTQAGSVISGTAETTPISYNLDPLLLVSGTNILAAEVHQKHGLFGVLSTDLYFDFELTGVFNYGNAAPAISLFEPADFALVHAPTNILLQAAVQDEGFTFFGYTVQFFADGALLGSDSLPPFSFLWSNAPAGEHLLTAVVTDLGGLSSTSDPIHLVVAPASGPLFSLIPAGATWSYLDTGVTPTTNWTSSNYRSRWSSGPAQLGYGDGDEATVVGYGPSPLNKYITTWFRRSFTRPTSVTSLTLRVLRDDGVIVYLNGTEILRNNLPAGTITAATPASSTVSGASESIWIVTNLNMNVVGPLLVAGNNLVAVEVHQDSGSSPDLSFDLELLATGNYPPNVALTTPIDNAWFLIPTNILLTANATDPYGAIANVVFSADGATLGTVTTPPYQWTWTNPPIGAHNLSAMAMDNSAVTVNSPIVPVLVLGATTLSITRTGAQIELTWPSLNAGYTLETATSLASPILWASVTNAVTQSNGQFRLVVDSAMTAQYFRLRAP